MERTATRLNPMCGEIFLGPALKGHDLAPEGEVAEEGVERVLEGRRLVLLEEEMPNPANGQSSANIRHPSGRYTPLPRPDITLQEAAQQKPADRLPALLSEAKRRESVQRVVVEKRNHAQHGAHERRDRDARSDQLCQVFCCQNLLRLGAEFCGRTCRRRCTVKAD